MREIAFSVWAATGHEDFMCEAGDLNARCAFRGNSKFTSQFRLQPVSELRPVTLIN